MARMDQIEATVGGNDSLSRSALLIDLAKQPIERMTS
jgi:hypothetical protein